MTRQKLIRILLWLLIAASGLYACKKKTRKTSDTIRNPNDPFPKAYTKPECETGLDSVFTTAAGKTYKLSVFKYVGAVNSNGGLEIRLERGVEYLVLRFNHFFSGDSANYDVVTDADFSNSIHNCNIRGTIQMYKYGAVNCRNMGAIHQHYNPDKRTYRITACEIQTDWVAGFTGEKETPLISFDFKFSD